MSILSRRTLTTVVNVTTSHSADSNPTEPVSRTESNSTISSQVSEEITHKDTSVLVNTSSSLSYENRTQELDHSVKNESLIDKTYGEDNRIVSTTSKTHIESTTDPMVVTLVEIGKVPDPTYYRCTIRYQDYKIQLPKYNIAPKWGTTVMITIECFNEVSRKGIKPEMIEFSAYHFEQCLSRVEIDGNDRIGLGKYRIPFVVPTGVDLIRLEVKCTYKGMVFTDTCRMNCSR